MQAHWNPAWDSVTRLYLKVDAILSNHSQSENCLQWNLHVCICMFVCMYVCMYVCTQGNKIYSMATASSWASLPSMYMPVQMLIATDLLYMDETRVKMPVAITAALYQFHL